MATGRTAITVMVITATATTAAVNSATVVARAGIAARADRTVTRRRIRTRAKSLRLYLRVTPGQDVQAKCYAFHSALPPSRPSRRFPFASAYGCCMVKFHDAVYLHHRRRGLLSWQGSFGGGARRAAPGARLPRPAQEIRPLYQRRSGHHEPVSARRGLCHR